MICFCLLNPQTVSYLEEARDENIPKRKMLEYITNKIVIGSVPKLSNNYEYRRLTAWSNLQEAGTACLKVNVRERASVNQLQETFKKGPVYNCYPLRIHQGSAIENCETVSSKNIRISMK